MDVSEIGGPFYMNYVIISRLIKSGGLPCIFSTDQALGELIRVHGPAMAPTTRELAQKLALDRRIISIKRDPVNRINLWSIRL